MSASRWFLALLAPVLLMALPGCSGGVSQVANQPDAAPAGGQAADAPSTAPSAPSERLIARTAEVWLVVDDISGAAASLTSLAGSFAGQVTAEDLHYGDENSSSTVVLQVDATRLDDALAKIGALGRVTSQSISAEDVTTQAVDIEARLRNMDASIARLTELLKRAEKVSDLTELESQLTQRQAERDALAARRKALADRVALSTLTVQLSTPTHPINAQTPGFLGGLAIGWDALVRTGATAVTVVGALLPFAAVAALIIVPIVWWRRRRHKARTAPLPSAVAATEAPEAPQDDTVQP